MDKCEEANLKRKKLWEKHRDYYREHNGAEPIEARVSVGSQTYAISQLVSIMEMGINCGNEREYAHLIFDDIMYKLRKPVTEEIERMVKEYNENSNLKRS